MDYFIVDIATTERLNLTGSDLLVYSALVYLSKRKAWKGSTYELAKYSRCGSAKTAERALNRLLHKGIIVRDEQGLSLRQNDALTRQNDAVLRQNDAKLKESSKENINKEKSLPANNNKPSDGRLAGFFKWWSLYSPTGDNVRRKKACLDFWMDDNLMPNDWRKLAIERAKEHDPDRNPLFWLQDGEFLKIGRGKSDAPQNEQPDWLNRDEQTNCLLAHIPLATSWNPDTKSYGVVTLDQANRL